MNLAVAAAAAIGLAMALSGSEARAAACCGTGHGVGQWLAPSERAGASFGLRATERYGAWTSDRDVALTERGDYDRELSASLGWMARVGRRFQLGVEAPFLGTWKRLGGVKAAGGGAGDVKALGRFDALDSGEAWWAPSLSLTFAATIPTGRSPRDATDPYGADVTGLGAAELRPGVVVEKTFRSGVHATASASLGFRTTTTTARGDEVRLAPRLSILAAAGPTWSSGASLVLGGLYEREAGAAIGGRTSPGATRERTALLAVLAYDADARWTAVASLLVDLPIVGLGRNEVALLSPSIGVRYVWGTHD